MIGYPVPTRIPSTTSHVLSPATEARVLQQVATGRSTAPDDLLNHAPADTPAPSAPGAGIISVTVDELNRPKRPNPSAKSRIVAKTPFLCRPHSAVKLFVIVKKT